MKIPFDISLYLVTDSGRFGRERLCQTVMEAIRGGVTLVQLREKDLDGAQLYQTAMALHEVTKSAGVPLLIDDRVDIALAVDAEGVHLGASDLPLSIGRKLLGPDKILGATAKTVQSALDAQSAGADYVGVGAIFPTTTKVITRKTDISTLIAIKETVDIPVVAIGGIDEENISNLFQTNVDGVAVVSAIMGSKEAESAAKGLRTLVKGLSKG